MSWTTVFGRQLMFPGYVDNARELALAALARVQFGAFTRDQARSLGYTARMIDARVNRGLWVVLHPGVYAFASAPSFWFQDEMAACLWSKGWAAGMAAGHLWGLPNCDNPPIEVVTTDRHKAMPRCGIKVHYTNRLPREQRAHRKGVPVTSIERTLMDLCGQWHPTRAAIAIDNALFRGLTTIGDCDRCLYLTARRGRNGCKVFREKIRARFDLAEFPNSGLETLIFEMLNSSHLPMPELQYEIRAPDGSFVARPDFVYPVEKLAVEGHSRLWHTGKEKEDDDVKRHQRLIDVGYRVIYVTKADATKYKTQTLRLIERLLEERRRLFFRSERARR